jgi:uncharacterized protein YdeI (BOF family)
MKTQSKLILLLLLVATLFSCKGEGASSNDNEQTSATASGQHIGPTADSTTVDGPKGSVSND